MNQISPSRLRQTCLLLTMMALAVVWALPASAQIMKKASLQTLLDKSDYVFLATCTKKEVSFKNGNIVSRYLLKPSKVIKGNLKLDAKTGEVCVEELGGEMTEPLPIGQMRPGMANLTEGQDLLLFSAYPRDNSQNSLLANQKRSLSRDSLRIVGGHMGYYTVFQHPETGVKLLKKGELVNPPSKAGEPVRQVMKQIELQRERALASAGLDSTATQEDMMKVIGEQKAQLEKVEKVAQVVGENIDKLAMRDRSRRDQEALKDPSVSDDIYEYESLDSVVRRLERMVSQSESEK